MSRLLLFLLLLLSPTLFCFQPSSGSSAIEKARSFQDSLNRAVRQRDERAVSGHISNFFTGVTCTGYTKGDKRTITQSLLAEQHQGVVTSARDDGTLVHYELNYGNKKMEYQIGSKQTAALPRLLLIARERNC